MRAGSARLKFEHSPTELADKLSRKQLWSSRHHHAPLRDKAAPSLPLLLPGVYDAPMIFDRVCGHEDADSRRNQRHVTQPD